ncbi:MULTISPECIES: serine/threonine protein kinase [unclassified Streptomyces]|uniref:Serine/threonine protein kinase n=1 Tax=Streptomyces sp. NBC_00119 TaxID=2975659 RepID=A0AAU1U5M9_9ACTN|nr:MULTISPECIES: serine/threonine protein kinase [unclassified Streptomyces]MCX4642789.1 serine/threonine protein kinase [Streptomyces sp. NBC_01446]MCX5323914.1 serine/threonine protein kinase [Streptomyces sp. NBC_00120]
MPTPDAESGAGARAARRIGPYTVITRLDGRASRAAPVPEHRYIARTPDGDRTVLVSVPLTGADPQRYMIEADASRYLLGPWASPATELAAPGDSPWHARPYLPALPLPTALAVHGGPLPEHTVRALGAALAETLVVAHGQNLTHAGVSPAAVLLAPDGPRLTCFGAVRAAAPDGTSRSGLPGLDPGSLPPEQAAGGRPRPLGDVYALGATLAFAAAGHTAPERDELPLSVRSLVGRCLSRDPGARPQLAELMDEFAPDEASAPTGFQPVSRASALLTPGWLPARVIAAVAHQSAAVLAAEIAPPENPLWAPPIPVSAHRQERQD